MHVQIMAEVEIVAHIRLLPTPHNNIVAVRPVITTVIMAQRPTAVVVINEVVALNRTPARNEIRWVVGIIGKRLPVPKIDAPVITSFPERWMVRWTIKHCIHQRYLSLQTQTLCGLGRNNGPDLTVLKITLWRTKFPPPVCTGQSPVQQRDDGADAIEHTGAFPNNR